MYGSRPADAVRIPAGSLDEITGNQNPANPTIAGFFMFPTFPKQLISTKIFECTKTIWFTIFASR